MANSITRYFKGIWYALIGRANLPTGKLLENPEAVRGIYEDISRAKRANIQRYKQAIGQLMALVEQKRLSLKKLTDEVDDLEKKKANATQKAKTIAAELREAGTPEEEVEQHPEYIRCVSANDDFDYTLKRKNVRVAKLERDIKRAQEDIECHKAQILDLQRDLEKIKTEQSEVIEDIITAREQEEIDDMLSGISKNDDSVELARIQEEIRQKVVEGVNEQSETDGDKKPK
ncbi:hypothetical protein C6501_03630 [Candidatus Poribacteria bacterium]|nr:MAG: hypothetical protein C6501_03630 [Candidatus Poribacteria bacterium]